MKLRMLLSLAGSDFALSRGDETERFGDAEAMRLVEAAYAVVVSPPPEDFVVVSGATDIPAAPDDEISLSGANVIDGVDSAAETAPADISASDLVEPAAPGDELLLAAAIGDAEVVAETSPADETATDLAEPTSDEASLSVSQPLLVEDDTERAVRSPSRKRRG